MSPPPLPPLSLPAVNAAIRNATLAQRKASFSQASTHRCDSENISLLSLRLHVAYLSLTQCSLPTLSRKLLLSIGKSIRVPNCILKLHTQPHSCAQKQSHSATIAFRHTRTQPRPLSSAKLALSDTRTQAHSRSSTLALSQSRTQQHWDSGALSLSRTRTQAHSRSAKVAISNTRTQPHSHFRIYFVVTESFFFPYGNPCVLQNVL